MKYSKRQLTFIGLSLSLISSFPAFADNHLIFDVKGEYTHNPAAGYGSRFTGIDQAVGWTNEHWLTRVGFNYSGVFETDDNKNPRQVNFGSNDNSGTILVKGIYFEAAKIIQFQYLNLELGAGIARTSLSTYLHTRYLGTVSSVDPTFSFGLTKEISSLIALQLNTKFTPGVADGNLKQLTFGVRFKL